MERFAAAEALRLLTEHHATMAEGIPAMYPMLPVRPELDEADLSSLTRCTVGGQTIPLSTTERRQTRSGAPLIELRGTPTPSTRNRCQAPSAWPSPG